MTFHQFKLDAERFCHSSSEWFYTQAHMERFWTTYNVAKRYLSTDSKVLSVGCGNAIVEKFLLREFACKIYLVDFPEAIEHFKAQFKYYGFRSCGADLSTDFINGHQLCDLILCTEVIEHLPLAPADLIARLSHILQPNGKILITTPKLNRVSNILRLIFGWSLLEDPQKTFGPVNAENQGVHRREYTMSELKQALHKNKLNVLYSQYFKWRSHLLVVGSTVSPETDNFWL